MATRIQDRVRDDLTNRGIRGGVVSRAIERTGLPSASAAASTASGIRNVQKQKQQSASGAQGLVARAGALAGLRGSRGAGRAQGPPQFDPSRPQGVVVSNKGTGRAGENKFGLTVNVGGRGQRQTFQFTDFKSLQDKAKELQEQGVQIVIPGVQEGFEANDLQSLVKGGAFRRSDPATVKSFLGQNRRTGIFEQVSTLNRLAGLVGGQTSKSDLLANKVVGGA